MASTTHDMAAAASGKRDARAGPLKTFEYLASGRPAVASGLPESEGMESHRVVADGADRFIAAVEDALATRAEPEDEARRLLSPTHTWETRTRPLLEVVGAEFE